MPTTQAMTSAGAYTDGLHMLEAEGFLSGTLTAVPVYVPHADDAPAVTGALDGLHSLHGSVTATGPGWIHADSAALVVAIPRQEIGRSWTAGSRCVGRCADQGTARLASTRCVLRIRHGVSGSTGSLSGA
ncbi:hypothetical protein [Streptomyces sp. NPDC004680]|uniref:hypothetical protein n=1 Tax=Streptomyces sp. NPDC004680 TaxID=3154287 RepID=UPI0033A106B0